MLRPIGIFALITCTLGVDSFHADAVAQQNEARVKREVISRTEPFYPTIARRARLTGAVRLQVKVTPDGRPASITVLGGNPFFVKAGMEATAKWRWVRASGDTEELVQLTFQNP